VRGKREAKGAREKEDIEERGEREGDVGRGDAGETKVPRTGHGEAAPSAWKHVQRKAGGRGVEGRHGFVQKSTSKYGAHEYAKGGTNHKEKEKKGVHCHAREEGEAARRSAARWIRPRLARWSY
jgi:hypothetical protein